MMILWLVVKEMGAYKQYNAFHHSPSHHRTFPDSCLPNLSIDIVATNTANVFQTPSVNSPCMHKWKCVPAVEKFHG